MKFFGLFFLLFLSTNVASAQSYFQKTYGGSGNETGVSIDLTSDGGIILGGITNSFGSGSNDIYLVKLDAAFDTMWTKAVGTGASESASWLEQTNDNGYIITGTNGSLYLNKVDASGVSVWAKSYGGSSSDEGKYVQQTPDNGYIVTGFTSSLGAGGTDVYLIKTDVNGDTLWTKTFGGSSNDRGYSLDQTSDGGYIVCGETNSYGAGSSDVILLKVNAAGVLQWSKTYGGTASDEGRSVLETADGGFILTGTTLSFGSGLEDIFTIKTDSLGTIEWSKAYGMGDGDDKGHSIVQTSDGGYSITGTTNSNMSLSDVVYLLKIDAVGAATWPSGILRTFGSGTTNDGGNAVRQAADGGYIIAAYTFGYGAGSSDAYLVKTDTLGLNSNICGTGGFIPVVGSPATTEASATLSSGTGGTVTSIAAVSISASTATTKLPLGVLITTTGVSCFGDTDGQALAVPSAGSPPYTYVWSVGVSTTSLNSNLPSGTHGLSVLDALGCQQLDSFTIAEPSELLLSYTIDTIAGCGGGSNGVITGSASGGTSPYDYVWSNGNSLSNTSDTSHTINGLAVGTYILTVTDVNGCTAIDTIKSGMTFAITSVDAMCMTANGSASVSVTGGDTPYTFLWNDPSTQTNDTATGLTPGVYSVMVTDSNGCSDSTSVTVNTAFGGPTLTIDSVINVSCFGANDGEIYMTITDLPFGVPPYTILWSNTAATDDITGLSGGTYTVEVTETGPGCVSSTMATVLEPSSALTVTITDSSDVTCNGAADGSATLSASGGTAPFTYSWSLGGGSGTIATGLGANTYTATVLDANGCNSASSVTLSEPSALVLATDTSGESCVGGDGKAWVTATGGIGPFTYAWSDVGAQVTDTAFNLTAGSYTVTVTDNNGCSNTAGAVIVQNGNPPSITTDSANSVTCNGGSDGSIYISISGGTGPFTYSWSPGSQSSEDITGLTAGSNIVTVVDNLGCGATSTITISEPNALSIVVAGTDITCNGVGDGTASVTASDGTGPYTYLWSSSGASSSETGLAAGYATVTVTDNCGATASDSVDIIDPAGITISPPVAVDILCNGAADGSITITATGGTAPLSYSIDSGATFPNTSGAFTGLSGGSYFIVVRDSNNCATYGSSITINEPTALSIDSELSTDVTGCAGSPTGTITLSASGGTGPITFSIDSGSSYQANDSFTSLLAGTYIVMIQDNNLCLLQGTSLTINEPTGIVINSQGSTDITCNGANDGTITITASGGAGALTYSLDGGATYPNTSGSFTGLSAGTYDVYVQDTIPCLIQVNSFTIVDPAGITIASESKTDIDCFGDADGTIDITASGGTLPLSYSIDGGSTFSNTTGSFVNLNSGSYSIVVQDSNGCTQAGSILVLTEPTSAVAFSDSVVDVTGCSGSSNGSIYLTGSGGTGALVYSIDSSATFDNGSGIFANLQGGSYTLSAQDENGCTVMGATVWIAQPTALTITIQSQSDPSKGVCDGFISILPFGGTPSYTYLWDDTSNQTNSTATNLCGGPYLIRVTDANGCTDTMTITLTAPDNDLFIPSAFSPNGDGENDLFKVRGSLASLTMIIYNRWGEKIFESNDQDKGWDGKQNGTEAISDSYGYYIEVELPDGSSEIFKGDIVLLR